MGPPCAAGERARLWRAGDLAGFGRLVGESCASSIASYETGSPELVASEFARACPELADRARAFVVESDDGLRPS